MWSKSSDLDLNQEPADKVADEINASRRNSNWCGCKRIDKEALEAAKEIIERELGTCDILLNGAGGNNPKGTTDDEFYNLEAVKNNPEMKTFFELDPKGVGFVFDLNFLGTLLPSQVFAKE